MGAGVSRADGREGVSLFERGLAREPADFKSV